MRYLKQATIFAVVGLILSSCKKEATPTTFPLASLNIINATVNLGTVKANFTGNGLPNYWAGITTTIAYGANTAYAVNANTSVPLTIATSADSTHPVYSNTLKYSNGSYYTLFLAGQSGAVDTLMIKESFQNYNDSSFGVRFINLSYNSNPIVVTLSTTTTTNEFGPLNYKGYSSFKKYNAAYPVASYTFQVRDAASNSLLGSYTIISPSSPIPYFHNITLAWIGQTGGTGTNATKVIRINHY